MINTNNFKLIAHRGLLEGPSKELENDLALIKNNIKKYPFLINEIDVQIAEEIYIGHEKTNIVVDPTFLVENSKNLVVHIKHIETDKPKSMENLKLIHDKCHFFSHDADDFTITNYGWIWQHPRLGVVSKTICVMPETFISLSSNEFASKLHLLWECVPISH